MKETSPSPAQDHRHDEVASTDRRRLLRAAVSAAPIIATLPSGAALAQASTSHCILDSITQSATATDAVAVPNCSTGAGDGWLRLCASRARFKQGASTFVFALNFGTAGWYNETTGVLLDGTWTQQPTPAITYRQVLVLQKPYPNGTNPERLYKPADGPICNGSTDPGIVTTPDYDGCFFPLAKRQPANINGNTAIMASCWTSFL
jgi:hypothetical protein